MNVNNSPMQTLEASAEHPDVYTVIDQRHLPHNLVHITVTSVAMTCAIIKDMAIRGAPLIGVTAAFGMVQAAKEAGGSGAAYQKNLERLALQIKATRPTAINLAWAVNRMLQVLARCESRADAVPQALAEALRIRDEDVEMCRSIGRHGLKLIEEIYSRTRRTVNILTHCNAGWLACIDWGTATSPIYHAHDAGIPVHVWVDETRPRNQGAKLTAWELGQHGVPHTLIADNTGGHLMQHGMVDMAIVGSDRTTARGDVANKIGTYHKALAAKDNGVPFYVALPSSTIDWTIQDGVTEIPIEERDENEVRRMDGQGAHGIGEVLVCPQTTHARNYGFDVTPARLVSGLITERGICKADTASMLQLFPERK